MVMQINPGRFILNAFQCVECTFWVCYKICYNLLFVKKNMKIIKKSTTLYSGAKWSYFTIAVTTQEYLGQWNSFNHVCYF